MPLITFMPDSKVCVVEKGVTLQAAAEKAGVTLSFPCAGKGVCGKCMVRIDQGSVEFNDNGKLPKELRDQGFVLACRSKVLEDADIFVTSVEDEKGQFSDALSYMSVDENLFPKPEDKKPLITAENLTVDAPAQGDGLGDYDRFLNAARSHFGTDSIDLPLTCLRYLPDALRQNDGDISVWYMRKSDTIHVVDITPGKPEANYGLAIDIGTTTIAVQLVDLDNAKIMDTITLYNAQIDRGADVISRISYAKNPERVGEMRSLVLSTINRGISEICAKNGNIQKRNIHNVSIAGNTTMTQLFMGINPEFIRLEPYTPTLMGVPLYTAESLGLEISPCAYAWIAPNVGSYVGGDITSGLLCTEFAAGAEEICLFIDVGTNGEIVLGNEDFLMGCACSAGPAFEGGGIERGMRASFGAIDRVEVNPQSGKCDYLVIGGGEPKGICGSGLISLLSQLLGVGIIDQRGKLDQSGKFESVRTRRKNS
ncbi:MAG: ASKHA domain-containing protein, partial [Synergistaceae bacterium]|nr:ASKHA domain-containing protein [Synergistaceae bacterium]